MAKLDYYQSNTGILELAYLCNTQTSNPDCASASLLMQPLHNVIIVDIVEAISILVTLSHK